MENKISYLDFLKMEPMVKLDYILTYLDHDKETEQIESICRVLWGNVPLEYRTVLPKCKS